MLTLKFREKTNWRTMVKVEAKIKAAAGAGVKATAEGIVNDIRSSWSGAHQKMGSGSPPAIDTGVLDSSVMVDQQGRDVLGRFRSKADAEVWYVRVDTAANDPDGENYAMALEDPDYYNLPFIAPALDRAEGYFSSNIKRFMRL